MYEPIILLKLVVEGFGSIQTPVQFELDRGGINLVRGRMGHGKTSLFSALFWAAYGQNLKGTANDKVATWEALRGPEYRGTRVCLYFERGEDLYLIARHLNFKGTTLKHKADSKLLIFKNDELLTNQYKKDQQQLITELLGMDAKAFVNSVVFGQRMQRLVEADNEDKRELFSTLFELEFIKNAHTKAARELTAVNSEIDGYTIQYSGYLSANVSAQHSLNQAEKLTEDFTTEKAAHVSKLEKRLADAEADRQDVRDELAELEQTKPEVNNETLTAAKQSVTFAEGLVTQTKANLATAEAELDTLQREAKRIQIEQLERVSEVAKDSLDTAKEGVTRTTKELRELREEITSNERIKAKLELSLEDIVDTCPTCSQALNKKQVEDSRKSLRKQVDKQTEVLAVLGSKVAPAEATVATATNEATILEGRYIEAKEAVTNFTPQLTTAIEKQQRKVTLATKALTTAKEQLATAEAAVRTVQATFAAFEKWQREERGLQDELRTLEASIAATKQGLVDEEARKAPAFDWEALRVAVGKTEADKQDVAEKLEAAKEKATGLNWWIKKAFSASGIRAYVFSVMLNKLNEYAAKYADRLGFAIRFSVDLEKASRPFTTLIVRSDGLAVSYPELSGGEKQSVDICLAFAMHDLLSHKIPLNILILDEVFEGLDAPQMGAVFELIRIKAGNRTVFVITHAELLDAMGTKTISVEKIDNQTYVLG